MGYRVKMPQLLDQKICSSNSRDIQMSSPVSVNLMPTAKIETIVELAKLSEKLGYRRCWIYDEGLHTRDVYVTLTSIAIATKKIL